MYLLDVRNNPIVDYSRPSRRLILRTISGLTAFGICSVLTSSSVAADAGDQQWAFELENGVRDLTVVDGTIFFCSGENLYAVNRETGTEEWVFELENSVRSLTVVDGIGFFTSGSNLHAIDIETRTEEWAFEVENDPFGPLIVVDGIVFVGDRDTDSDESNLYAVDAETGSEKWIFKSDGLISSDLTVADGTVFFGDFNGFLYAVDTETGQEEWTFIAYNFSSSPTVVDGTVFVGSNVGKLYAVDAETGSEEWAFETGKIGSSPTVADGTVFVSSADDNHNLYAVDAETGSEEWIFEINGSSTSSPTVADGTVFTGGFGNIMYAVDIETGQEEWAFETDSRFMTPPIVVDGTLFFGADNTLYAVDAGVSGSSEGSRTRLGTYGHHDDWAYADQSITVSEQQTNSGQGNNSAQDSGQENNPEQDSDSGEVFPSVGVVPSPAMIVAGGGAVGAGLYAWRQSRQSGYDTVTNPAEIDSDAESHSIPDSSTEDATIDSEQEQKRTTEALLTQAEEFEASGQYQQATEAYERVINIFEQRTTEESEELKPEIQEIQAALKHVTTVGEEHESIATTLQAAERSFKEAIVRYVAGNQTVARIRFRQARDAFEDTQQKIVESDTELLAQPISVSFEEEVTLSSMALEEITVLDESTLETLSAVDIESFSDLEADGEKITPTVVSDLQQSDEINDEEAGLLTMCSWWYEGDSREFTSETVISRRHEQAQYGFNRST